MNGHMAQRFSVVMPLYNKEREVGRAIESVLAQTCSSFELIVVNDGSTDRGAEVAGAYTDDRIRIVHQPNRGECAARNTGIDTAACDLIAFIDADDEWLPTFLETIAGLTEKFPGAGVFATGFLADHGGGWRGRVRARGVPSGPWEGLAPRYFRGESIIWSSAVAIRKGVFQDVGYFREGVRIGGDLDMWARAAAVYAVAYSSEPRAVYHLDASNRVCMMHHLTSPLFIRRSLAQIEQDPRVSREVKEDARRYVARFERLAVNAIHQNGQRRTARRLARLWRQEYGASISWFLLRLRIMLPPSLTRRCAVGREWLIERAARARRMAGV